MKKNWKNRRWKNFLTEKKCEKKALYSVPQVEFEKANASESQMWVITVHKSSAQETLWLLLDIGRGAVQALSETEFFYTSRYTQLNAPP